MGLPSSAGWLLLSVGATGLFSACTLSVLDGLSGGVSTQAVVSDGGTMDASGSDSRSVKESSTTPNTSLFRPDAPLQEASVLYDDSAVGGPSDVSMAIDANKANDAAAEAGCSGGCPGKGYCLGSQCVYASCKERLGALPQSPSGVYLIDPDLSGNDPPFSAFCGMTLAGGGWTLLMKIDGRNSTFAYDSPLWEDSAPFRPELADYDTQEAKLASYSAVAFATLLIGMHDGAGTRWTTLSLGGSSLRDVMATGFHPTALGRDIWERLPNGGSLQLNCNLEGVNVVTPNVQIRLGIAANEQNDCNSCDSFIGFGAQNFGTKLACGNLARFGTDHGDRVDPDFGYIMAR